MTVLAVLPPDPQEMTRVQYSYLIIGVYSLISSIAFSFTYLVWFKYEELKGKNRPETHTKNGREDETSENIDKKLEPMWFRIPMVLFMFLRFGTLVTLEIVYASFLMTFAVKGLNWTKQDGLAVTSVFRASFAAARGLSICLAAVVSPTKMIIKDLVILISAFVVLLIWVEANNLVLWVGSGVVGFGMGVVVCFVHELGRWPDDNNWKGRFHICYRHMDWCTDHTRISGLSV